MGGDRTHRGTGGGFWDRAQLRQFPAEILRNLNLRLRASRVIGLCILHWFFHDRGDHAGPRTVDFGPMKTNTLRCVVVLALLWLAASAAERSAQAVGYPTPFRSGQQSVGIIAGHRLALPIGGSSGSNIQELRFLYLAPRWGIGLSDPMGGNSWYRGNVELLIEGTFLYCFEPKNGIAGGITPLIRYIFLADERVIPFAQLGAGILALDFNLRRQADGFNFTPQAGLGIQYIVSERAAFTGEWRYLHISNAGIHERNAGINSSLVLLGVTLFPR
jgi:lipid A 3-O-deacylase